MEQEYKASEEQLKSLVEKSTKCEQSINIDCVNSPLKTLNGEKAWWTDYEGNTVATFFNELVGKGMFD